MTAPAQDLRQGGPTSHFDKGRRRGLLTIHLVEDSMRRFMFALVILAATLISGPSTAWAQAAKGGGSSKARATATNPVNLNSASAAQLQTLPGVGASTAQRIVEYRQKNGNFKKIEDILETSRSCPYLLTILRVSVHRPVARNR
jgi:competence ComEA-like helix-hairpin-helix protein